MRRVMEGCREICPEAVFRLHTKHTEILFFFFGGKVLVMEIIVGLKLHMMNTLYYYQTVSLFNLKNCT